MQSVKLSIITPVFNCARFIGEAIESVARQDCDGIEHIIVDGGSEDGTLVIIAEKAARYPHIRWVSERDRGQSDAMNKGIAMARGEILGFLNADDFYEAHLFADVLRLFEELPRPSLLVGNCTVWKSEGVVDFVSRPSRISLQNMLLGLYLEAFPMNSSAYFYHKSLHDSIGGYDVDDHYSMDMQFIYRALMKAQVKYVDRSFGHFRCFEGTKTFVDYHNGGNRIRVTEVTEKYLQMMPRYYRVYLQSVRFFRNRFPQLLQ